MLYLLKQNLPHGQFKLDFCTFKKYIFLSTIRNETPRGHVEPCDAMNLNTRRYPEYFMIYLHQSLSNIYKHIIYDHISSYLIFRIAVGPKSSPTAKTCLSWWYSFLLLDPKSDGICKVELHKIDPKTHPSTCAATRALPRNSNLP